MKRLLTIVILNCMICVSGMAQNKVELKLDSAYMNFPGSYDDGENVRLELVIDGKVVRFFEVLFPDSDPDFWTCLDVSEFKGKDALLRTISGKQHKGLKLIYQSDKREYLKNAYKEKLRPQLHFSSRRGWLNDANGLVYYDGEYHLFYQHNPYGIRWSDDMHWGHAVSPDLLHWEQLPVALHPDEVGVIFSGCAVIDHKNTSGFKTGDEDVMVAIYTSVWRSEGQREVIQKQSLAYSNDKGRTWTKYAGNPVIGDRRAIIGTNDCRDPNVFWHEPTKKWVMVLYESRWFSIFTSDSLKDWNYESKFGQWDECPEMFELPVDGNPDNKKWVTYDAREFYEIGSFNGTHFIKESGPYRYQEGAFMAAQCFENIPASDGRQIQIGWGQIATPDMPFNQMMAFPTVLTLRTTKDGIRMFNEPVKEIEKLHKESHKWENLTIEEANEKLKGIDSRLLHIKCEIENINSIAYSIIIDNDVLYRETKKNLFRFNDGDSRSMPKQMKYLPESESNNISYEFIVDRTSIEVFVDHGRFAMVCARRFNPEKRGIRFKAGDGHATKDEIKINKLEVYEMQSIWK